MRCEMDCSNKAKVKVSSSGWGECKLLCYKHGFAYVKALMRALGDYDLGIYVQRAPKKKEVADEPE